MELLQDLNRDYRRYSHSPRERTYLGLNGLQHIQSSNVSSVGVKGESLIIRFHNGSMYEYPNQASQYENMLKSNSKGKWVWRNLRRKNVLYRKIGVLPLPDDIGVTDEEIFQEIDNRYMADLTRHVDVPVFQSFEFIKGINYQKIQVGNINVYKAITQPLPLTPTPTPTPTISVDPRQVLEVSFEPPSENWKSNKSSTIIYDELKNTVENTFKKPVNQLNQKIDLLFKKQSKYFPDIVINPTTSQDRYARGKAVTIGKIENLNDVEKNLEMLTTVHELGHAFDKKIAEEVMGEKTLFSISNINSFVKTYKKRATTGNVKLSKEFLDNWVKKTYTEVIENLPPKQKAIVNAGLKFDESVEKYLSKNEYRSTITSKQSFIDLKEQVEQHKEIRKEKNTDKENNFFNDNPSYSIVSDIYDAFSKGNFQANQVVVWGHGKKYYNDEKLIRSEIFTELITINRVDPKVYETLKTDFPEIVESFEEIIELSVDFLEENIG